MQAQAETTEAQLVRDIAELTVRAQTSQQEAAKEKSARQDKEQKLAALEAKHKEVSEGLERTKTELQSEKEAHAKAEKEVATLREGLAGEESQLQQEKQKVASMQARLDALREEKLHLEAEMEHARYALCVCVSVCVCSTRRVGACYHSVVRVCGVVSLSFSLLCRVDAVQARERLEAQMQDVQKQLADQKKKTVR